jgi:hypothetical protein
MALIDGAYIQKLVIQKYGDGYVILVYHSEESVTIYNCDLNSLKVEEVKLLEVQPPKEL